MRPAARAEAEGQAPSTGKLTFEDDVGNVRTCSYALDQVRPWTRAMALLCDSRVLVLRCPASDLNLSPVPREFSAGMLRCPAVEMTFQLCPDYLRGRIAVAA